MDGLNDFVVMAKRATYAAGAAKSLPYRLGTSDLQFHHGPWSYHDSYVGEADFLGQELVYRSMRPVWSMAYYGYLLDSERIDAVRAGGTVQSALTRLYAEGRFLGGFVVDVGEFRYVDTNAGPVERFTGEEWIECDGRRVYELRYFGGLLRY